MLSAVRLTLSFLTASERVKYLAFIVARALTGLLDIVGLALIALIASIGASNLSVDANSEPPRLLGIELPSVNGAGLLWLVIIVLGVFLAKAVVAILLVRAQAYFVARVETRNAEQITELLLTGSLADAKRYSKADFQFAITSSTVFAFTGLMNNIATLFAEGFLLVVITVAFFVVDPLAAVFALLYFGLVIVVIQGVIGRSLRLAGTEAVEGTVETINTISDTLDTFREISVLQKQALFLRRVTRSRERIARSGATMTFLGGMPRYVVETALILGVVVLVAQQFFSSTIESGIVTVGVFLAGGVRMMASLLPLQNAISNLRQNARQAMPALDLLEQSRAKRKHSVSAAEGGPPPGLSASGGLALQLNDVCYRYPGADADTIHGISLSVAPGAYAAIIGPSGAGKTTIVDLILGLIEPDSGGVTIDGAEPVALRRQEPGVIAYVPQKPGLVSGTIAENIALGVDPANIDRAQLGRVIDAAYLREYIDSLPLGSDTSVGKQADSLSGGQIQRIGVARALYSSPRLLVLDEATSGLDASSEAFIAATLRKLRSEVTVIVIAHRLSTVQHADIVHVIEDGKLTASGDFPSVRANVAMVAEYVKLMSFDDDAKAVIPG